MKLKSPLFLFLSDIHLNTKSVILLLTLRLEFCEHFITECFMGDIYQVDLIIRKHHLLQKYHLSSSLSN